MVELTELSMNSVLPIYSNLKRLLGFFEIILKKFNDRLKLKDLIELDYA